jgi:hypothetical protein
MPKVEVSEADRGPTPSQVLFMKALVCVVVVALNVAFAYEIHKSRVRSGHVANKVTLYDIHEDDKGGVHFVENGRPRYVSKRINGHTEVVPVPGRAALSRLACDLLEESGHVDSDPNADEVTGKKSKESPTDVVGGSGADGVVSASEGPG